MLVNESTAGEANPKPASQQGTIVKGAPAAPAGPAAAVPAAVEGAKVAPTVPRSLIPRRTSVATFASTKATAAASVAAATKAIINPTSRHSTVKSQVAVPNGTNGSANTHKIAKVIKSTTAAEDRVMALTEENQRLRAIKVQLQTKVEHLEKKGKVGQVKGRDKGKAQEQEKVYEETKAELDRKTALVAELQRQLDNSKPSVTAAADLRHRLAVMQADINYLVGASRKVGRPWEEQMRNNMVFEWNRYFQREQAEETSALKSKVWGLNERLEKVLAEGGKPEELASKDTTTEATTSTSVPAQHCE